jgi:hypothetical protein
MSWSALAAQIIRQFEKTPRPNPLEADFHAYNKLLYTLFPADTDFTVVPQYMPSDTREAFLFEAR